MDLSTHRACYIRHPPSHTKNGVPVGTREKRTAPLLAPAKSIAPAGYRAARPTMLSAGLPSRHRLLTVQTTVPVADLPSRRAPSPPAYRPDERLPLPASRLGARPLRRPFVQARAPAASLPSRRASPPPACRPDEHPPPLASRPGVSPLHRSSVHARDPATRLTSRRPPPLPASPRLPSSAYRL
jgi:hypothetical protein